MMKWTLMICLMFVGLSMTRAMVDDDKDDEKKVTVHKGDKDGDDPVNQDSIDQKKDHISVEDTLVYEDFDIRKDGEPTGSDRTMSKGDDHSEKTTWGTCNSNRVPGTIFIIVGDNNHEGDNNGEGLDIKPDVNLYPNPATASSTITVDVSGFENASITIRTMTGQTLYNINVSDSKTVLPHLATGTYLITVQDGSNARTMRLLVQ